MSSSDTADQPLSSSSLQNHLDSSHQTAPDDDHKFLSDLISVVESPVSVAEISNNKGNSVKRMAKNVGKKARKLGQRKQRATGGSSTKTTLTDKDISDNGEDMPSLELDLDPPEVRRRGSLEGVGSRLSGLLNRGSDKEANQELEHEEVNEQGQHGRENEAKLNVEEPRRHSEGCLDLLDEDSEDEVEEDAPVRLSDPGLIMEAVKNNRPSPRNRPLRRALSQQRLQRARTRSGKSPLSRRMGLEKTQSCRDVTSGYRRAMILEQVEGRRQPRARKATPPRSSSSDHMPASSFRRVNSCVKRTISADSEEDPATNSNHRWLVERRSGGRTARLEKKASLDKSKESAAVSKVDPSTDIAASVTALLTLMEGLQQEVTALRQEVKELRPLKKLLKEKSSLDES